MPITKDFQVVENRIFYKCAACGAKRTLTVPYDVRQVSARCHKCGEITRCRLNRRFRRREQQAGKAMLVTLEGREFEINLADISDQGVGFDIPVGVARAHVVNLGAEVKLRCNWNSRLFSTSRFVVRNVSGQRVGAKKISL